MPRFKVWFERNYNVGYYSIAQDAPDANTLNEVWKDDSFYVGISLEDESDLPPIIREYRESLEQAAVGREAPQPLHH